MPFNLSKMATADNRSTITACRIRGKKMYRLSWKASDGVLHKEFFPTYEAAEAKRLKIIGEMPAGKTDEPGTVTIIKQNLDFAPQVFAPPKPKEKIAVAILCFLAMVHVFIYSAAFPFFNNVDEVWHFDMVVKYSRGHFPRGLEPVSEESTAYLTAFNSLAYLGRTNLFRGGELPPPLWTQ